MNRFVLIAVAVAVAVAVGVVAAGAGIQRPIRAAALVLTVLLAVRLGIVRHRGERRRVKQGPAVAAVPSDPAPDRFVLIEPLSATDPRWEVRSWNDQLLATGEARFIAVRDEMTFYIDEERERPWFIIRRWHAVDPRVRSEVMTPEGRVLGTLAKRPLPGPFRVRWTLEHAGARFVVLERSFGGAVLRRLSVLPYRVALECRRDDGMVVLRARRRHGFSDRYDVELAGEGLPFPLAVAAVVVPDGHHDL